MQQSLVGNLTIYLFLLSFISRLDNELFFTKISAYLKRKKGDVCITFIYWALLYNTTLFRYTIRRTWPSASMSKSVTPFAVKTRTIFPATLKVRNYKFCCIWQLNLNYPCFKVVPAKLVIALSVRIKLLYPTIS